MADDELRLRATLEDRITDSMRAIFKNLRDFAGQADRTHSEGQRAVDKHREAYLKLHKAIKDSVDTFRSGFIPAMEQTGFQIAEVGVGIGSVTGAIAAATAAARSFSGESVRLMHVAAQTGLPRDTARMWEEVGGRIGVTAGDMDASLANFGERMDIIRRSPAIAWQKFFGGVEGANMQQVFAAMVKLKDMPRADQLSAIVHQLYQAAPTIGGQPTYEMRERVFEAIGMSPTVASAMASETEDQIKEHFKRVSAIMQTWGDDSQRMGVEAAENWSDFGLMMSQIQVFVGSRFVGTFNEATSAVLKYLKAIGPAVVSVGGQLIGSKPQWEYAIEAAKRFAGNLKDLHAEMMPKIDKALGLPGGQAPNTDPWLHLFRADASVPGLIEDLSTKLNAVVLSIKNLKTELSGGFSWKALDDFFTSGGNMGVDPFAKIKDDVTAFKAWWADNFKLHVDFSQLRTEIESDLPHIDWSAIFNLGGLEAMIGQAADKVRAFFEWMKGGGVGPAQAAPVAPTPGGPPIVLPNLGGMDQFKAQVPPSTPSAPTLPQFAPGYSPIAFHVTGGQSLKDSSPSSVQDAINIIRVGVYEGLSDFSESGPGGGLGGGGGAGGLGGGGGFTKASFGGSATSPSGATGGGYSDAGPGISGSARDAAKTITDVFRKAGATDEGIAAALANAADESGFRSGITSVRGEIGLWQFRGTEKQRYLAWMAQNHPGENWGSATLQAQYQVENLKKNYPEVWRELLTHTPAGQQAADWVSGYEHPAKAYEAMRRGHYLRGVPPVGHYTGGDTKIGRQSALQPGDLTRAARGGGPQAHTVRGEASLSVALAGGLRPVGGVKRKGDLFKTIRLARAATPYADTES